MDGKRFDDLTQRLGSIRLTRGSALRGMAASALTLAGITTVAEEASAGKRRRPICHCPTPGELCTTQRLRRKQRNAHLREDVCDYKGECSNNINACAAAPIFIDIDLLGDDCSGNPNVCGDNSGLTCVLGICVPIDLGRSCTTNGQCSTGQCTLGECADCLTICGTTNTPQCCAVDAQCDPLLDRCVLD